MTGSLAELSAKARRGELTEAEERQLRLVLTGSLEARLAHRAGLEFDEEDSVQPGDDALAARVTARVLASVQPLPMKHRRLGWRLVTAAALTVAAAAAGPPLVERLGGSSPPAPASAEAVAPTLASPPRGVARPRAGAQAPALAASASSTPPNEAPAAPLRESTAPAREGARGDGSPAAVGGDPATLFAEASRARRQGQVGQAIALYRDLQQRYPSAAEAHAADIALGMLNSGRSPSVALTHFHRYLEIGGPLTPEALWGQAEALDALGRTAEARQAWQTLLTRYPRSTYADAARAKLGPVQ
ncbi:MAG: tetratricopeptide repeat protein [Polyangiaceae bacterium]|nr:tetratricopeptide repeat protein [Polyangiaceae bacterium]